MEIYKYVVKNNDEFAKAFSQLFGEYFNIPTEEKKVKKKQPTKESLSMDYEFYLKKALAKSGVTLTDELFSQFKTFFRRYPFIAASIVLKEVALKLDKKYPDHIAECPVVYGVSAVDGSTITIKTKDVLSFKTFAAFRTLEDLDLGLKIAMPLLIDAFSNEGKQKN